MVRRSVGITILIIAAITATTFEASAIDGSLTGLEELISSFDDPNMDSYDLAFYLATHGYNAIPEDGHVDLVIESSRYVLTPNGDKPNLCDLTVNEESQLLSRHK